MFLVALSLITMSEAYGKPEESNTTQDPTDIPFPGKTESSENKKVPNFKIDFESLEELSKSQALSSETQKLISGCLQIIKDLNNNTNASGTADEIQSAKSYTAQMLTLKKRLSDTSSSDKITKIQELSEDGKNEIDQNQKIVEKLHQVDSLQKLTELPGINETVAAKIKEYIKVLTSIDQATTLDKAYRIEGIPQEFIDVTKKDHDNFEKMKQINSVATLKKFPGIKRELIEEIEQLEQIQEYIKCKTDTVEGILAIPGLQEDGRSAVARLFTERDVLKEQIEELTQKLQIISGQMDKASEITRNEYYFRMIVISLINYALFGFDFVRGNDFDENAGTYNNSIISHATSLWPHSDGLNKTQWRSTAEYLGLMLQIALSVDNISEYTELLNSFIYKAMDRTKTINSPESRFIQDSLRQLSDVLLRYKKNKNNMQFDDFNDRKRMILKKIEMEQQKLHPAMPKQTKKKHVTRKKVIVKKSKASMKTKQAAMDKKQQMNGQKI